MSAKPTTDIETVVRTTKEAVNLGAAPQFECELELTPSASIGASFLDQQVGSEI